MRPNLSILLIFLCCHIVCMEAKLQQQATIDANDDEDEDDRDDEDDGDIGHFKEVDDDGKIYKNPRNSPSSVCPRDEKQVDAQGQKCLRRCSTDEDCKSKKKKCRCDGPCGMSCIKPDRMCPDLPELEHGKMIVTGKLFGDSAHYVCDDNYMLVGLSERTCRADGRWIGSTPVCKNDPNSFCIAPPRLENARHYAPADQKGFDVETTVQYFCDYGFQTMGFQHAKCILMDGKASWFGPDVSCAPVDCGIPAAIDNGQHVGECYTYGCQVSYHCADGFRLDGKIERVCQADGMWYPKDLPQCVQGAPAQCPLPEHPRNGKAIFTSYSYNAIVSYECKPDFVIKGSVTRECQADRKWSGQAPVCEEINCGSPGILYNGWIENIESGTGLGASIIFRCNEHMKLVGNTSSVCQRDGKWRYPLPSCLAPCIIPQIEKGNITVASRGRDHINNVTVVEHGERLSVHCVKNYEFAPNNTPVVCRNGTWSIIPSCAPARCKQMPKSPKNGMVIAPKMTHGMRAIFKCKDGFSLVGGGPDNSSMHVECHYGTWIGDIPHCIEVYCAFPGYVANGKVLLVGNMGVYDYRSYVKKVPNNKQIMYDCDKGYVLDDGPTGATCVGGKWSPRDLPKCLPGQHPRLRWSRRRRSIDNSLLQPNATSLKTFIEFFKRVGNQLLELQQEKIQWNATLKTNSSLNPMLIRHNTTSVIACGKVNATDPGKFESNCQIDGLIVRKKHKSKNSIDDKMIDLLKVIYRKLKRLDGKFVSNGTNMTMHEMFNLMSRNFFHLDLSRHNRTNTLSKNHERLQVRNQREFSKLKREFERIIKFYNKSLRWGDKRKKDSARKNARRNEKNSNERKLRKENKSQNYYRGFYEFINGYVNERLSILESNTTKLNIDKFAVAANGTTFTVGEIYAFFKHIIENKLNKAEATTRAVEQVTTVSSRTTAAEVGSNEIPALGNKTQVAKHRTKRIRNASEANVNARKRKLLSINSMLASEARDAGGDGNGDYQHSKSKQFTLDGLDAQQQSRSKRFLPLSELDNQIILKNLYLNAYEDEYRANVKRSIISDNGHSNWTTLKRRKGNLDHYRAK